MSREHNEQSTVGQWVSEHPQTARLFETLKIDYCCGGGKTLAQACTEKGLQPQEIIAQLVSVSAQEPATDEKNWLDAPLGELCQHIEQTHHAYLKDELPRLSGLVDKVANAHGENHPALFELRAVFEELRAELEPHMAKEEQILFPAVRHLEQAAECPQFPFGTVANPIRMMEHEHDVAGTALGKIRELTDDFQAPPDACNSYRVMVDSLRHLERDLHQHIHKENNIMFPRAQRLEEQLAGATAKR
jgi:regulator of cell morphogenesis and NO signaling